MAKPLPIVATSAMDAYYANYKDASQFFDLSDFIFHCGATASDFYQKQYEARYAELRALKQEDVVGFPADWLLSQTLKVERKDGETFVKLTKNIMAFTYSNESVGAQDVLPVRPRDANLERTTLAASWQNKLVPFTNRIFWWIQKDRILFFNKGGCNINEVEVFYIPSINEEMLVPEGIIKYVVDQTVSTMRQLEQGIIVKKAADGQPNLVLEGEVNKNSLK